MNRGADKSLARTTSRCILFDGANISFDAGLYYIKNQQATNLAVLFISHCKITLHVSDAFYVHHQEY
jgi:hypothetical protein